MSETQAIGTSGLSTTEWVLVICGVVSVVLLVVLLIKVFFGRSQNAAFQEAQKHLAQLSEKADLLEEALKAQGASYSQELSRTREELTGTITNTVTGNVAQLGTALRGEQSAQRSAMEERLSAQNKTIEERFAAQGKTIEERLVSQNSLLEQRLGRVSENLQNIAQSNHADMEKMRQANQESLDKINGTVSEKLQKTLDERISRSFEQVTQRLNEVNKGLGEMREVASGVTDLKKVLAGVKTRGTIGEYQLKAILEETLSPGQYEEQVAVKPKSPERVDFAVKMPGSGAEKEGDARDFVYLPIDSKFPADAYEQLLDAMEEGSAEQIRAARKSLETRVKTQAKSISEKYISVPATTNFAIMFFPFEGLYGEVVNMPGLVSFLQEAYRINIAGPSTMAALLNSLQMGFRTLEIQRRSAEVWKILEDARREFAKFEEGLSKTRDRLRQADDELERLVGARTRQINRALGKVHISGELEAQAVDGQKGKEGAV